MSIRLIVKLFVKAHTHICNKITPQWKMFYQIAVYSLFMILCRCNPIQPLQVQSEHTDSVESESVNKWWNEASRALGVVIGDCWSVATPAPLHDDVRKLQQQQQRRQVAVLISCLQHRTRGALTAALSSDVIPLAEGVELVRYQARNATGSIRGVRMRNEKSEQNTSISGGWRSLLFDSISDVFETHAIRITIRDLQATQHEIEARRRRKRNHMLPLMMFGLVGLGMILIPMGFQFLAVLGGKALLLAKMALILSSIQGLKKVATSNIHYGLYQSSPENPWYDRKAEDIERPYKMDDVYYNQYPEHLVEYKRYPRV